MSPEEKETKRRHAKSRKATASQEDQDKAARALLAQQALANPFVFLSLKDLGDLLGFSQSAMTAMARHEEGFQDMPLVFGKGNPRMVMQWIEANHERLRKVND